MKRFLFIILAGVLYFAGIPVCCADYGSPNYLSPDDARMRLIDQELDKAETSRNDHNAVPASSIVPKRSELDFSSELYWAKYEEPKRFSQKGFLSGYNAQYARRISTDPKSIINMFSLQGQWADGKFKQPSYEGLNGIKDSTYDLRGVVGKDLYPSSYMRATPYLGYGFRYLKDNSNGLVASFNNGAFIVPGYNRFSHYNYLPLGVDIVYQKDPLYSIESNLEYDYMFFGWQVSKLGVYPGYSTLVVDQNGGNGLRGSLRYNLYLNHFTAFAEAFYRYWGIAQSKTKPDPTGLTNGLYEPRDDTQEFGVRLGLEI